MMQYTTELTPYW